MAHLTNPVRLALYALCALCTMACVTPPDRDGVLAEARVLPFDVVHRDAVWCERSRWRWWAKKDCADWYRIDSTRPERIDVSLAQTTWISGESSLNLTLTDREGRVLDMVQLQRDGSLTLVWEPRDRRHYLTVRPLERFRSRLDYEIVARQADPPPPKVRIEVPQFRTERGRVLELERDPAGDPIVLIGIGRRQGAQVGQRGRLLVDGDVITEVEILEVYDDGSRARLDPEAVRRVTPETEAEIDVRVGKP